MTALIDGYDAVLFDLDGVVYLGPDPVDGAVDGIADLRERGTKIGFVTNNAARTAASVADHLRRLGIACTCDDVVTSAQAAARLLADRFPERGRVLVVGTQALVQEVEQYGFTTTRSADDAPVAVVQGYDPQMSWPILAEAGFAIQAGAVWIATNTDPTRPTDRGLVPGNGAAVGALQTVSPVEPEIAGKPYRPLMEETIRRLDAGRPIFVGDRTDTDIAGARSCGVDSLLVLCGAHRACDLLAAPPDQRPTHLGQDLRALLAPARTARLDGTPATRLTVRCGDEGAELIDGRLTVYGTGLDGLWALAQLAWAAADRGESVDPGPALAALHVR